MKKKPITDAPQAGDGKDSDELGYHSDQHTICAVCGKDKHTPLRRDDMGGYVCLTCIDREMDALMHARELLMDLAQCSFHSLCALLDEEEAANEALDASWQRAQQYLLKLEAPAAQPERNRDTERLDWFEKEAPVILLVDSRWELDWAISEDGQISKHTSGETVRAAIDAAIAQRDAARKEGM